MVAVSARVARGVLGLGVGLSIGFGAPPAVAGKATVIDMTQTACQFLEAENGVDHDFTTTRRADCEAINARTEARRLTAARIMRLAPGPYVFRIRNRDVPYELGFWLREKDYNWRNPLHKLTKLSVMGGGLMTGESRDYHVELPAGRYLYSCPLNTTPDYELIVGE